VETGLKRRFELMRMSHTTFGGCNVRRLAVGLLAIWLSGAGCLFCCGRDLPASTAFERDRSADRLAVPAAADPHSCCKARVNARADKGSRYSFAASRVTGHERRAGGGANAAACCERAGQVSDQARKQRVLFDSGTNSAATRSPHSLTHINTIQASVFGDHSENRRKIHLRCCVFLI